MQLIVVVKVAFTFKISFLTQRITKFKVYLKDDNVILLLRVTFYFMTICRQAQSRQSYQVILFLILVLT